MRNSWARAFLERFDEFLEDDIDMGDKLFYPRLWARQREATQPVDECKGGCGWPAAMCHCEALANIFEKAVAVAQRYCETCNRPIEQCDCLPFADAREVQE